MSPQAVASKHLFLLQRVGPKSARLASVYLHDHGIRVLHRDGDAALVALATPEQVAKALTSGLFSAATDRVIAKAELAALPVAQSQVAERWNTALSPAVAELLADRSQEGKSWGSPDREPEGPPTRVDPERLRQMVLDHLGMTEKQLFAWQEKRETLATEGRAFAAYERRLAQAAGDEQLAYELARAAMHLPPAYRLALLDLPQGALQPFLVTADKWRMQGEVAVGVVFVESSRRGGPAFSATDRSKLEALISSGQEWLVGQSPMAAGLYWTFDWQFVRIDVADGNQNSEEDYWRNPAMAKVRYRGNNYTADLAGLKKYRDDMKAATGAAYALVIFVTPFGTRWHAYACTYHRKVTLARRNNWGGWGLSYIDRITAHEVCHLFHGADEYSGAGTPCTTCEGSCGYYGLPNGNCEVCARPHQSCVMSANSKRLCPHTQGHLGWADLFVELFTGNAEHAGTDDDVWLDIGDRTFKLDVPDHDDRERNQREGYALNYTGIKDGDIKRIGLRKAPDGTKGGWQLDRVRVWSAGKLLCDRSGLGYWLQDPYRWWVCDTYLVPRPTSDIVNRLQVVITTGDVADAGTDDAVTLFLGGKSWSLDNPGVDDFERGRTDVFNLDPNTGLYRRMLTSVKLRKAPDGKKGGWYLKGVKVIANGKAIYDNQKINRWLSGSNLEWSDTIRLAPAAEPAEVVLQA